MRVPTVIRLTLLRGLSAFLISVATVVCSVHAGETTLVIKGGSGEPGDKIKISDDANVSVSVGTNIITITLPDLDVRLRCGGPVDDEYCYLALDGAGDLADADFDGVPDAWDNCAGTPGAAWTDNKGCSNPDNDGKHGIEDACPFVAGPSSNDGCPLATYTVTPSISRGQGTISPATAQQITEGATATFTLSPDTDYEVDNVTSTCGGSLNTAETQFTTGSITKDCTVVVAFGSTVATPTGYCDTDVGGVSCLTSRTMDVWGKRPAYPQAENFIPIGKILSYPFTYGDGNAAVKGDVDVNSNQPNLLGGQMVRAWFSEKAGGPLLNNNVACEAQYSTGIFSLGWDDTSSTVCELGTDEAVYHLNFEVRCLSQRQIDNPNYDPDDPSSDEPEKVPECPDDSVRWDERYYFELANY